MTGFTPFESAFKRRLLALTAGISLLAALVYALTLADYFFPGESAKLLAQWTGVDAQTFPLHSVWGRCVGWAAGSALSSGMALRVNLLSYVCGVLSAGLLTYFVAFFVHQTVHQEDAVRFVSGASLAAGAVTGLSFVFATATWQSSTHLDYRLFDVAFALVLFLPLLAAARWPRFTAGAGGLLGLGVALGVIESEIFLALLPVYLLALLVVTVRNGRNYYLSVGLFLVLLAVGYVLFLSEVSSSFLARPEAAAANYDGMGAVFQEFGRLYARDIRQWFGRSGWLFVLVLTVLPFASCAFAALRALNNERTWSQYFYHLAMTVCVVLALATPLSPESLMRRYGISPVATTTLAAAVAGYLAAYWYLLARIAKPRAEYKEDDVDVVFTFGRRLAPVALSALVAILALAALLNGFNCRRDRGAFADAVANEILDRLGGRSWIVTDGLLDAHLRALAATRGQELNLVCLHRDMDEAYLKEFGQLVKAKGLSVPRADLGMSVQLGVLPFLQDWFMGDKEVVKKAVIFGVPDFWYMAEKTPVPECVFFGGAANVKDVDGAKARAAFLDYWKKASAYLVDDPKQGSRALRTLDDPVAVMKLHLRRHAGFVANNLGVTLQDLGLDEQAFELYELVLKEIDCDNVCALFNEFEMARAGVKAAVRHKVNIEKKLRAIVDDPKRRYQLWSLSRYYGYIRSPEIFARMGFAWARSGQTGNAIAQVQRAIDFVPADRQAGLLNMMAAIYAGGKETKKSRDIYEKVLAGDAANHDALMGLARLSLQAGSVDEAKKYVERAVKDRKEAGGMEWALLHLMNNDISSARLAMQKVTDIQPKSLQAWSLLAGVLLQQYDQEKDARARTKVMEELENVILPRMEKTADTPRDYFVQMTRGLVLMRKGKAFQRAARDALVVASIARPDVSVTGEMILNLDIAMDDGENALSDARRILRRDRYDRLANYVMGSLRLKEGDYSAAETFLRISCQADHPIAAAENDLAETLRRLQRYDEAENFARRAVKTAPELYVAWETLGSTLLDAGKSLDEAEECVKKAIKLTKEKAKIEDMRMQITLARVQFARGELGRARGTLRALREHESELSSYDRDVLEQLNKKLRK